MEITSFDWLSDVTSMADSVKAQDSHTEDQELKLERGHGMAFLVTNAKRLNVDTGSNRNAYKTTKRTKSPAHFICRRSKLNHHEADLSFSEQVGGKAHVLMLQDDTCRDIIVTVSVIYNKWDMRVGVNV